ncbi:Wadjet anti-phage system protein JetD domain-containing protein [Lamprocystis purpurea]|jgi:hypothetical protein|uniref:Wadjet anti-phage system protein JetD domain-containing protein n=1 Tax=Lamprocystis purpurea TaxID=61598 RepID=UPI000368F3E5|nr:Wadjet anti-phage system protein JetD domain-containing protein [Lamprocystis purpurea]
MSALSWQDPDLQWTLVTLLEFGEIRRNAANATLVDWLREAGWVGQGSRRDLFLLRPAKRAAVAVRLAEGWPDWQRDLAALAAAGLPCDAAGLRQLRRCGVPLAALPPRLHRKTWMARFGAHSKAGTPDALPPPTLVLTDDDLLRLRPNRGLALRFADGEVRDCDDWVRPLGELVIPQRALCDGLSLCGTLPRWVMTVENLGAYLDLPAPSQALVVHQPGWNCRLARHLIGLLPAEVSWWHFGDLDPEGLAIFAALGGELRRPRLFLPDWWSDYLDTHALPLGPGQGWPGTESDRGAGLLALLRRRGRWLEQEAILLDPRLPDSLAGIT